MPTVTYTVINGVIVHEDRDGVQRNYRPDTLGNTVALTDATTTTDTMAYWPYGGRVAGLSGMDRARSSRFSGNTRTRGAASAQAPGYGPGRRGSHPGRAGP